MPIPTQARAVDNVIAGFQDDLQAIVAKARRAVIDYLTGRLAIEDGQILKTPANLRILRGVAAQFAREMKRAGYDGLVEKFVHDFNDQFVYFDEVVAQLGRDIGQDLKITFSSADKNLFASQQLSTMNLLEDVVVTVAADAQRQALLSVGGLKLADLINEIADQMDKSVGEATTLADTAMSTFYRTVLDRGYQQVQKELPQTIEMRYKYAGPDDRITRPFCHKRLLEAANGRTWTREQIDEMSNGQIPACFVTAGGFNCRHQWLAVFKQS